MQIFGFIQDVLKPAFNLVDELHTSEEEKNNARVKLLNIQNEFQSKVLDYESKLIESQQKQIQIELIGKGWLQRNWRPITMLVFLLLIVLDSFKLIPGGLDPSAWSVVKFGLSGYVVGRSLEKTVGSLKGLGK